MSSNFQHSGQFLKLELLGIGSMRDLAFQKNLDQSLEELGINSTIEHIRDINTLLDYGITGIPALRVNERVIFQNIVPQVEDIKLVLRLIQEQKQWKRKRIRRIIVPTDFSPAASNALQYALALAKDIKAKVKVVHIHQPQMDIAGNISIGDIPTEIHRKQEKLDQFISANQENVKSKEKTNLETEIISGFPVEELRRISKQKDTDLIIMSTRGQSNIVEKIIGNIAIEVGRKAGCPVLLVPQKATFQAWKEIVFANDYLHNRADTIAPLINLASKFHSELHFVNIADELPNGDLQQQIPVGNAHNFFEFNLTINKIKGDHIIETLKSYTTAVQANLLVMTAVKRSFLDSIFHKSQTKQMFYRADTPLLLLHE